MKINSVNQSQKNNVAFSGVVFHNKRNIAEIGEKFVNSLLDAEIIKTFKKRTDYNLHIKYEETNHTTQWKIKSIGQGIRGFFNNFLAPWKKTPIKQLKNHEVDEYISFYHPSHEEIVEMIKNDKKISAQIRANLKAKRENENILIDKMKKVEKNKD